MKRVEVFRVDGQRVNRQSTLPMEIQKAINERIQATADELVESEIVADGLSSLAHGGCALVKMVFEVKKKGGDK